MEKKYRYITKISDVSFGGKREPISNGGYSCHAYDNDRAIASICGQVLPSGKIWLHFLGLEVESLDLREDVESQLLHQFITWASSLPTAPYIEVHVLPCPNEDQTAIRDWYIQKGFIWVENTEEGHPILRYYQ